jgi:hypothetical protein
MFILSRVCVSKWINKWLCEYGLRKLININNNNNKMNKQKMQKNDADKTNKK